MCVFPYKYRKIMEMLPKLMKLCEKIGRRCTSRCASTTRCCEHGLGYVHAFVHL